MTPYEVPLSASPQKLLIDLLGVTYSLTVRFNSASSLWYLDIADALGNPILVGIPLVTGCDLLEQYAHLGINGSLYAQTDGDLSAPPTSDNLGTSSHLYFAVP